MSPVGKYFLGSKVFICGSETLGPNVMQGVDKNERSLNAGAERFFKERESGAFSKTLSQNILTRCGK